jgi:histidyl-tRNA synthetase
MNPDIYIVNLGDEARSKALMIAESLRDHHYNIAVNMEGASFKSQMKKADKSHANIAFIIGEDEVEKKCIQIKLLREEGSQVSVEDKDVLTHLTSMIN